MMIERNFPRRGAVVLWLTLGLAGACSSHVDITPPPVTVQLTGAPFPCTASNTFDLAVGDVQTALPNNGVCLRTDAAAQYVLHTIFQSTTASAQTQVSVTGFDITTATAGPALASRVAESESSLGLTLAPQRSTAQRSMDARFRNMERSVYAPRMTGARTAMRARSLASRSMVTPNVGDIIQLNANSGDCDNPTYKSARVAAVTAKAIVVADPDNPSGGFTDADYQSIGVTFDTLVDVVDRAAFGDPTDIDANSHVIIFYTREVNVLSKTGDPGFVEGFFNPRDLFPRTATAQLPACPGSNFAEMFYVMVPDPNNTINNFATNKTTVKNGTIAVIAHEYQHLINGSRRLYITDANDFEEVWLNEGLSHIAEELIFYRAAGLASRSNITASVIQASQRRVDAFNQHEIGNFGRYHEFLTQPETTSPYADNDSLGSRGAIWSFLRYAADRTASSDGTIWQKLVDSPSTGIPNLNAAFGTNILPWIRDWSISVFTDDYVSTSATFQQPSWNFRSIFPALQVATFPLHVVKLADRVASSSSLVAGGAMYSTFAAPAGTTVGAGWTAGSPNVVVSVVRTR